MTATNTHANKMVKTQPSEKELFTLHYVNQKPFFVAFYYRPTLPDTRFWCSPFPSSAAAEVHHLHFRAATLTRPLVS